MPGLHGFRQDGDDLVMRTQFLFGVSKNNIGDREHPAVQSLQNRVVIRDNDALTSQKPWGEIATHEVYVSEFVNENLFFALNLLGVKYIVFREIICACNDRL